MAVCGLKDGDARGAYRNINFDMRMYKRLRMYVHAEAGPDGTPLNDDDLTCFIRLGNDFENNCYEYEIPMKVTPWNTGDEDLVGRHRTTSTLSSASCRTSKSSGLRVTRCLMSTRGWTRIQCAPRSEGQPQFGQCSHGHGGRAESDKDDNVFDSDDDGLISAVWCG